MPASYSIAPAAEEDNADESNFKPRAYQDQLLEVVMAKNTIIYLPTGAGKTYIALMAMKRMASDLLKPLSEGGKRSVFLVNTVVLAKQQQVAIQKATALKVAVYTGDMNVDCWRRDRWLAEFEENQVLVATCQIILDVIRHGFVGFKHLNLLIFDECHHGRNEHPMHQMMRIYSEQPASDQPRIVGLTGMLISGSVKPHSVIESLDSLENTFHANIATVRSYQELNNVLVFSTNPKEHVLRYQNGSGDSEDTVELITKLVERMVLTVQRWPIDETHQKTNSHELKNRLTNTATYLQKLLNDFVYQMKDLGLYGASIAILAVIVELEIKKRSCETTRSRHLLRILITGAERIRHILVNEIYDGEEDDHDSATILTNSSPKIIHLFMYLRKYLQENDPKELKALVFVQRRHSAKNLYHVMKRFAESEGARFPVHADFMVGNNSTMPESVEAVLENKRNREVVKRFRKNEINLIVASSVLEEGVDLQMCNLVMSVDTPSSFRSYVQSKGRARMSTSNYVIMTPIGEYSGLLARLAEYKEVDAVLKEYLIVKAVDRTAPLREDIEREFGIDKTPVFKTRKGAILEEMSAVQLLNRYCNTLPNDSFTLATVTWTQHVTKDEKGGPYMVTVKVRLPMQSTVKEEIVSEQRLSLKSAKRSAAFRACVRLYENSELNDNLMPINSKRCMESVKPMYFKHWDNYEEANPKQAGTTGMVRMYPIAYPDAFTGSLPQPNTECFMYPIRMEPAFELSGDHPDIASMHKLLSTNSEFAILTTKLLPALGAMKFYFSFGGVRVHIESTPVKVHLNERVGSIAQLRTFHTMLFRDLLQTAKPFLVNDHSNCENSIFIVPVLHGVHLDWLTVQRFQRLAPCRVVDVSERGRKRFVPDDYLNKVVSPWYRADLSQRFVVTKVHTNLTPLSPFPSPEYRTFAEYFSDRYKVRTVNSSQFLIEVKGITQALNRLSAGQGKDGSKTRSFRTGPELLIPELCHNFEFPGDLWVKAVLLPSVLHRLHYLLHAEALRVSINRFLDNNVGLKCQPEPVLESKNRTVAEAVSPGSVVPNAAAKASPKSDSNIVANPWLDTLEGTDGIASVEPVQTTDSVIADPWKNTIDLFEHLEITSPPATVKEGYTESSDSVSFPWGEIEEPTDFSRNLESVFPVDLEYFNSFLNDYQSEVGLAHLMNECGLAENPPEPIINADDQRIDLLQVQPTTVSMGPQQRDILAALTSVASGDVFDGERLEVLGDSFLKFSSSVLLMKNHPEWHEGFLTSCKGQMVSNRNLYYLGNELLGGRLKVFGFDPKGSWQPPLMCVPAELKAILKSKGIPPQCLNKLDTTEEEQSTGCMSTKRIEEFLAAYIGQTVSKDTNMPMFSFLDQQRVADKTIADAIEATLGACVASFGIERSFNVLKFFGIFPPKADYTQLLHHRFTQPRLRSNIKQRDIDGLLPNYQQLERNLGYTFRDRAYLLQALTHPSFPTNSVTGCYQQLEFLGDAVLDMLVTAYIFERCPEMQQGKLTDLRSALVNNNTLACLCVRNQFHRYILSQNALLAEKIDHFAQFQRSHKHVITEQVLLLIGNEDVPMGEYIDVPKALGDVVEALIGAVFLDSGNDVAQTWGVVYRLMHAEIAQFMANTPIQVVRRLFEFKGAHPKFDNPYVDDDLVMITVRFTCRHELMQAHGFGRNSTDAKNAAAKVALQKLMA